MLGKLMDLLYLDIGDGIESSDGRWYKILHEIGSGGNAITYLVVESDGLGRGNIFALKMFNRLSNDERQERFEDEQEFIKDSEHPSILQYRDTGVWEEHPFLVSEYMPKTLRDVIREDEATVPQRISYSVQLLSALVYLDAQDPPVIHRDIKPANIFIRNNSCVLGDFGLMKRIDGSDEPDKQVWKESEENALPHFYRSPDLVKYAQDEEPLSTKSDVFQLGLVLTELFTGWNPAKRPENDDPLAPVELNDIGDVPGELSGSIVNLLAQMIEKDPDERPKAEEVMDGWMSLFENSANRAIGLNGRLF
jgi:serine/threonine protein kinase